MAATCRGSYIELACAGLDLLQLFAQAWGPCAGKMHPHAPCRVQAMNGAHSDGVHEEVRMSGTTHHPKGGASTSNGAASAGNGAASRGMAVELQDVHFGYSGAAQTGGHASAQAVTAPASGPHTRPATAERSVHDWLLQPVANRRSSLCCRGQGGPARRVHRHTSGQLVRHRRPIRQWQVDVATAADEDVRRHRRSDTHGRWVLRPAQGLTRPCHRCEAGRQP